MIALSNCQYPSQGPSAPYSVLPYKHIVLLPPIGPTCPGTPSHLPPCPGTLPGCTITALYLPPPQPHRLQYYLCLNPQPHSTILRSNILGPQDSLCQYGIYHITPIHQCRGAVNHHHHTCTHTHTQPLCNSSHTTA